MKRVFRLLLLGNLGVALPVFSALGQSTDPNFKYRLNKLYYWQIADELKLSPQQEKKLGECLDGFQAQREKALKDRDFILSSMKDLGDKPQAAQAEAVLKNYEKTISWLSRLDAQEYAELKKILGADGLTRFYVVREKILERLRIALVANPK